MKKRHEAKEAIEATLAAVVAAAKMSRAAKEAAAAIPMGFIEQDVKAGKSRNTPFSLCRFVQYPHSRFSLFAEHEAKRAKTEDGKIGFIEKDVIAENAK